MKQPKIFHEERQQFKIPFLDGNVKIPSMWPSTASVLELWKTLKEKFPLIESVPGVDGYCWSVKQWLEFVLGRGPYYNYIDDIDNLEIIVRGDGLLVADGRNCCFLIVTLGNFGMNGKLVGFNFPLCLAEVSESNREDVRKMFFPILKELNELSMCGQVNLCGGLRFNVRVEYGGDESWMRMLLGLKSSRELLACFKCFWERKTVV